VRAGGQTQASAALTLLTGARDSAIATSTVSRGVQGNPTQGIIHTPRIDVLADGACNEAMSPERETPGKLKRMETNQL